MVFMLSLLVVEVELTKGVGVLPLQLGLPPTFTGLMHPLGRSAQEAATRPTQVKRLLPMRSAQA